MKVCNNFPIKRVEWQNGYAFQVLQLLTMGHQGKKRLALTYSLAYLYTLDKQNHHMHARRGECAARVTREGKDTKQYI